jgi:hypothetical protein
MGHPVRTTRSSVTPSHGADAQGCTHSPSVRLVNHMVWSLPGVGLVTWSLPGARFGYMVTPGCQIGYIDYITWTILAVID